MLTHATHLNGWEPTVYMSWMSRKFRLFHVSNLSVRNFRVFLLMCTGSHDAIGARKVRGVAWCGVTGHVTDVTDVTSAVTCAGEMTPGGHRDGNDATRPTAESDRFVPWNEWWWVDDAWLVFPCFLFRQHMLIWIFRTNGVLLFSCIPNRLCSDHITMQKMIACV